jgi:cell division protein FtsW
VLRGVRAALHAEDEYGSYVAFGISALLGFQAVINLSVAMAILPTKGLTLPFVSYGGSSLVVSCAALGILLNISRARLPDLETEKAERRSKAASKGEAAAEDDEDDDDDEAEEAWA